MKKKEAREILGVQESDDEAVIKKAYRKLALKNHPDKNKGSEESKQKFQQISEAYKCLTDPKYFDENMDGMEGFSMDEEELFAMFNMMFGFDNMFDGGRGGGIGGGGGGLFDLFEFLDGGDDGIGGLFGGGGMGGGMMGGMGGMFDLPNVEDLTPSEMKVAEEFVNNGDEEGLFIYLQELKSRINKREKMDYDDNNNNNRNKSKNSRRNINGSTSSGSSSKNNDRKVSRANSSENKLKSSSSFLHYDDDDDFEDSDDERAQMEAFAAMLGMPPSLAKEMMNSDEMFSGSGGSSRNSKSKRTSRKMPSEMYDTQDMMGDEDLEQFAAMMGIPTALARQMMMEEMGDDGFNNRNSSTLRSNNNKKKKKKGKKKNSNASSANVYHRNTNRMNAEEMAFENFMMGFEGPNNNNNNNNNNRKSFEDEILRSLMSEMEFEKNNM